MQATETRLIFSDVDGAMPDARQQHPFTPDFVRRAMARGRMVFVSGRTFSELVALADDMGETPDFIGENGAFIATRDKWIAAALASTGSIVTLSDGWWIAALAAPRRVARAKMREVLGPSPNADAPLVADELPASDFAELTGYDMASARRAVRRHFSVLVHEAHPQVTARLRTSGLDATFRGRWLTVLAGSNKARAVNAYKAASERVHGAMQTVAIGDAGSDEAMLRAVDRPFVIHRAHAGHAHALTTIPGAQLLSRTGPKGWKEMVEILEQEDGDAA